MNVSIIITVYNCAQYLDRCFESIKKQTYNIYEIIIVDDGSSDMSAQICDEFASANDNVKVIHKLNGGTVSARRIGIEAATGDVIGFIDGDDWIDREFCAKLIQPFIKNTNIDVVSSGLFFEYVLNPKKNNANLYCAEEGLYKKEKIDSYVLPNFVYDLKKNNKMISTSICCKMLKRSIALEAMLDMDERLTIGEDGAYVLAVLLRTRNLFVIREALYHYEQHSVSQNNKFALSSYEQVKRLQQCMENMALRMGKFELVKSQINYFVKDYLRRIESSIFNTDEDGFVYLFPHDSIDVGSRIVIHGAGKVGQQYIKYIMRTNKYKLVGWTDKNNVYEFVDADIPCSINEIIKLKYDYIILASNEKYIIEQMKEDISQYNVEEEKILVNKPLSYRI